MSLFHSVPDTPDDAILSLALKFKADPSPNKVNLGVGAYRTPEGAPFPLPSLRRTAQKLLAHPQTNHEYLPQDGLSTLSQRAAALILGDNSPALARAVPVQALSGTGALRLALEFLRTHVTPTVTTVLVPVPTWPNHFGIAAAAGLQVQTYRYYNESTRALDLSGMLVDLRAAPRGAVVVLHGCAHNPTGCDPTADQWAQIEHAVIDAGLLPLFDVAYQGFASGSLDADAAAVRQFADHGRDLVIAQSFAKNMGLYGERIGALTIVLGADPAAADLKRVRDRLKRIARTMYSNPPAFGARVAALALGASAEWEADGAPEAVQRRAEWEAEVALMTDRLNEMRTKLGDGLVRDLGSDWAFVKQRTGMFAYLGLSSGQVAAIKDRFHVYMAAGGRISLAGLNDNNVQYVVEAIAAVVADDDRKPLTTDSTVTSKM